MENKRLVYFGPGGRYSFVSAALVGTIPGAFEKGEPYKTNAQLVDIDGTVEWVNLTPEQAKVAVAAETPQRRGHASSCSCGPCKREDRANREFLRTYVGAQ